MWKTCLAGKALVFQNEKEMSVFLIRKKVLFAMYPVRMAILSRLPQQFCEFLLLQSNIRNCTCPLSAFIKNMNKEVTEGY